MVRPDSCPSFLEREGQFRQRAWQWFEESVQPEPGDTVLALDADEFLVAGEDQDVSARTVGWAIGQAIEAAAANGSMAVMVPVPEVFDATCPDFLYTDPMVRTDGFWGTIAGTRLFRYQRGGTFRNRAMGSGAEPTFVADSAPRAPRYPGLSLLHLGYMDAADRRAKHQRYTELVDHGHANSHIQSIIARPTLEPWKGPWPAVWRGRS